jgi:hypothetical protein
MHWRGRKCSFLSPSFLSWRARWESSGRTLQGHVERAGHPRQRPSFHHRAKWAYAPSSLVILPSTMQTSNCFACQGGRGTLRLKGKGRRGNDAVSSGQRPMKVGPEVVTTVHMNERRPKTRSLAQTGLRPVLELSWEEIVHFLSEATSPPYPGSPFIVRFDSRFILNLIKLTLFPRYNIISIMHCNINTCIS